MMMRTDQRRRDLLRGGASLAVVVSAGALVGGCDMAGSYAIRDPGEGGSLAAALGPERWDVLTLAALAPSSHNVQPWTVRIEDRDRWTVGLDARRRLPAVDPGDREMLLSLGCFIETVAIAAASHGLSTTVAHMADGRRSGDPVRLSFAPGAKPELSTALIRKRRTVRAGVRGDALGAAEIAALQLADPELTYFPMSSPGGLWIAAATLAAFVAQSARDDAQRELAEWIRWTPGDIARHRTGLTPASMGLSWFAQLFTRLFFDKDTVMTPKFRQQGIEQTTAQVSEGAGWLVLASADDSVEALIACGRRAQNLWLRAGASDIGLHPMSQIIEEAPWRDQMREALAARGPVQMIFRAGRCVYPPPASARLAPAAFARLAA